MSLLTTAEVARQLAMSEEWVRDHAGELGAIKAGSGRRAPLRFEPQAIEDWKQRQRVNSTEIRPRRRRGSSQGPAGLDLLPPIGRSVLTVDR